MDQDPVVAKEGFTPVQGCLLGAVILFVLILGITIVLAYRQFRENTAAPSEPAALVSAAPVPVPALAVYVVSVPAFASSPVASLSASPAHAA